MEDDKTVRVHDIFNVDPIELQDFVGCYVIVNLVGDVNLLGVVYTIDPVSQSVILINDEDKSMSLKIIMKHSIVSMEIIPDIPLQLKNLKLNDLFTHTRNTAPSDISANKERVKLWLLKNMIDVEEIGDLLKLDSLEIHPPYTVHDCICNNSIVLDRVQQLLQNMVNKTPSKVDGGNSQ